MIRKSLVAPAVAIAALWLPLYAVAEDVNSGQEEPTLILEGAWVRAMPPSHSMTAAYVSIVNETDSAFGIVGATADVARVAEIHTTRNVDGFMQMEQLEGLAIAPGERVELEPGGTHIMLMGLTFMPAPGDTVNLCLKLLGDTEICTVAVTRR
ncbi:MAG: copper chaperone PCu(A)C [Halioglobus sp.]